MTDQLPESAQRVQQALRDRGFANTVVVMPDSTRTARDAAAACGCGVGQIAKSIVFRTTDSDRPVLVVTSGVNRVDEARIAEALGAPIGRADAAFVRETTGYAIGGVPPLGHAGPVTVFVDADLLQYDEIWAAAGTPRAVFRLTPAELQAMTGGRVVALA